MKKSCGFIAKYSHKKTILSLFILLFSSFYIFSQETTKIEIKSARETIYRKDPVTENDTIVLSGAVELSVTKGDSATEIKADKINYDRQTEMLFAEGNVEITTKSSSGNENTTASALLMNTATLEGVFDDGRVVQTQSDALNLPSGSTLIVFSDIFGKTEGNTIAFKNSSLTFCDDENPHWKIDASRTWLLPGGEFAFFNALLYVGPVPLIYLPAFYYPKDELIFNPVFGYKSREGYYVQTTTYLMGRKPLDSGSSSSSDSESLQALYNFMKPTSLKEQERQGLMLHNLDSSYTGSTSTFVKLEADMYSNLGVMLGLEGALQPSKDYITSLNFAANLGFSHTLFHNTSGYIPISSAGLRYYDKSNFLGLKLPFRYGGNLDLTLSKPFRLNLSLPVYSDPYFMYDFKERKETLDWISMLTGGESEETSASEVSSIAWKLTGSYSPVLPDYIKKYISSISMNWNSSVNISSTSNLEISEDERAKNRDSWSSYTPERRFYYPSQVTPLSFNMTLSGTLFQWPKSNSSNNSRVSFKVPLDKPEELKSAKELRDEENARLQKEEAERLAAEKEKENETEQSEDTSESEETDETQKEEELIFIQPEFPQIATTTLSTSTTKGLSYNLGYSLSPNLITQIAYSTSTYDENDRAYEYLKSPADFEWKNIKSFLYTIKSPLSVSSNLSYGNNILSVSNRIAYDPVWQGHPNADGYSQTQKSTLKLADYNASTQTVSNTNTINLKPFSYINTFSDTGISWNSTIKLYRRKFVGTDADNPEWENLGLDFTDNESVTAHTLDFTFAAKESDSKYKQSFRYSTTLPPQVTRHTFDLNLSFPYVSGSLGTGFQENSATDSTLIYNPLTESLNVSLFDSSLTLAQSFSYAYDFNKQEDSEKDPFHPESFRFSASWKKLSAAFVMSYTYNYNLDPTAGWIVEKEKKFIPYSLSMTYSPSTKTLYKWKNRITLTPGLSSSLVADLVRPTNSYFSISPSLTFKINEFFNLTFSSTSRNSILYWYFNKGIYDDGILGLDFFPFNMLLDLTNSFRFDSREKRESSGFKLKTLAMTVSHELDDWSFNMSWKFEPRLVTENGKKTYDYSPYISIGIVWNPMPSIKTTIVDNYGKWELNSDND